MRIREITWGGRGGSLGQTWHKVSRALSTHNQVNGWMDGCRGESAVVMERREREEKVVFKSGFRVK